MAKDGNTNRIERLVRHFQLRANMREIMRKLLPPILSILLLGIAANHFTKAIESSNSELKILALIVIVAWIGAIAFAARRLRQLSLMSQAQAKLKLEKSNNIEALAPLSSVSEKRATGDKELWQLSQKTRSEALKDIVAPQLLNRSDYYLIAAAVLCSGVFFSAPAQNLKALKPDFSILIDGVPIEITATAIPPEYTNLPNMELTEDNRHVELPQDTIIDIRVNGAKSAPKISYGSNEQKMQMDGSKSWQSSVKTEKSNSLKLHRFGIYDSWKIRVKKDRAPKIKNDFSISASGNDSVNLAFNANDDYGLKSAKLVLVSANKKIQTVIELDTQSIKLDEISNLNVKTSHSALVGQKVIGFIKIEDDKGQTTKSKSVKLNLQSPAFNSNFAKALQEVRLLILNETRGYKRASSDSMWINDPINGAKVKVVASDNIKFAPVNIARAYETLVAIHSVRGDLGLSVANSFNLTHAVKTLEYAETTIDAQKATDTLWNIIETFEHTNIDSRSKISNAIENLKAALKSGAGAEEIEMLKSELKAAISEHLQALAEQSGESGDMEIAEKEIAGKMDIEQVLNDAQDDASGGNADEADAKLDELNRMLSQMQPGGQGGGQSIQIDGLNQNGGYDPLAQEQQSLAEDTKNSGEGQNGSLIARQENLLSKIPEDNNSETPSDSKLNEARAAMNAALEALKRGDNETAHAAQIAALEALKGKSNNQETNNSGGNENNKDPLGRSLEQRETGVQEDAKSGKNGKNDGKQTKLPTKADPIKAHGILNRLRENLSKQNQTEEERNYLENVIAN